MSDKIFRFCVMLVLALVCLFLGYRLTPSKTDTKPDKQIILVQVNDNNLTMYDGSIEHSPIKLSENGEYVMAYIVRIKVPVPPQPQVQHQPKAEAIPTP